MVTLVRILLAAAAAIALSYHGFASWTLLTRTLWNEEAVQRPWRMMPGTPMVREVGPEAAEIGMKAGDEVVAVAGHQYYGLTDLEIALAGRRPGDKLAVEWLRGGSEFEGTLTLAPIGEARSVPVGWAPRLTQQVKTQLAVR
jgi:hypothetical protein